MRRADRETGPVQIASRPIAAPTALAPAATAAADRTYDDTVASLRQVVETHLTADPHVIDVLDRNLDSLDEAIADYRDALAQRPDDARLRERLDEARQRKIEILRQAAALATGAN
jgi:exonuclease VII small subunit